MRISTRNKLLHQLPFNFYRGQNDAYIEGVSYIVQNKEILLQALNQLEESLSRRSKTVMSGESTETSEEISEDLEIQQISYSKPDIFSAEGPDFNNDWLLPLCAIHKEFQQFNEILKSIELNLDMPVSFLKDGNKLFNASLDSAVDNNGSQPLGRPEYYAILNCTANICELWIKFNEATEHFSHSEYEHPSDTGRSDRSLSDSQDSLLGYSSASSERFSSRTYSSSDGSPASSPTLSQPPNSPPVEKAQSSRIQASSAHLALGLVDHEQQTRVPAGLTKMQLQVIDDINEIYEEIQYNGKTPDQNGEMFFDNSQLRPIRNAIAHMHDGSNTSMANLAKIFCHHKMIENSFLHTAMEKVKHLELPVVLDRNFFAREALVFSFDRLGFVNAGHPGVTMTRSATAQLPGTGVMKIISSCRQ